jgi:methylated-DNA-[protein]-cysteine S-methyltransferase
MNETSRAIENALKQAGSNHAGELAGLNEQLLARADREGLLDVAYATMDSPYGELLVAATDRGVVKLSLPSYTQESALEEISAGVSPRILESPKRLDPVRRELDSYFEGKLTRFDSKVDWSLSHGFTGRVLHAVARIPYGKTLSYGEVAEKAGNPRAFRAAGTACGVNPVPLIVPCHRVVQAGGKPGNYGGGPEMKLSLLEMEGALPGRLGKGQGA